MPGAVSRRLFRQAAGTRRFCPRRPAARLHRPLGRLAAALIAGSRRIDGRSLAAGLPRSAGLAIHPARRRVRARAVLGLMLPSVDRAGRYFPLTFAALHDGMAVDDGAAMPGSTDARRSAATRWNATRRRRRFPTRWGCPTCRTTTCRTTGMALPTRCGGAQAHRA